MAPVPQGAFSAPCVKRQWLRGDGLYQAFITGEMPVPSAGEGHLIPAR